MLPQQITRNGMSFNRVHVHTYEYYKSGRKGFKATEATYVTCMRAQHRSDRLI